LKLADLLASGPCSVAELAEATRTDKQTLYRILRALASDGVFAEREPGVFGNTEASALLCADSSGSWPEVAHLFGDVFYGAVATMDPRSPAETFPAAYGEDFWSWLEQHPVERAIFDAAMAGGKEGNAVRLAELEWRDGDTVATRTSCRRSCTTGMTSARPRSCARFARRLGRGRVCS
jgi:hypothetical protein